MTDDKTHCDKVKVKKPKSEQLYLTKLLPIAIGIAVEILKTLPPSTTYDWVGGDDLYGNSITLRKYLYYTQQAFVFDVSDDLGVYVKKSKLYIPTKKAG